MFCWVNSPFLLISVHIFLSQLMICVSIPVTFPIISSCFCPRNHFSGGMSTIIHIVHHVSLRFLILSTCFPHFFPELPSFFSSREVSSSAQKTPPEPLGARRHGDLLPVLRLRQRLRRGGWKAAGGEPWVPGTIGVCFCSKTGGKTMETLQDPWILYRNNDDLYI